MAKAQLALGLAVCLGIGGTARAESGELTITNSSSWDIREFYLSPTWEQADWGHDRLGESTLPQGLSHTVYYDLPCDDYDVKIVTADGDVNVLDDIRLCGEPLAYTVSDLPMADSTDDEALGDLGDLHAAQGETIKARAYYILAFKAQPGDTEWQRQVVAFGAADAAIAYLSGIATDDERLGDLGDLLLTAGRTWEACERWAQAYALDPTDSEWGPKLGESCPSYGISGPATPAPIPEETAPAPTDDLTLGREALARGDHEAAKAHFDAALGSDVTSKEALTGMIVASGRPATEILVGLTARAPHNDELWGDLGDTWLIAGEVAKARDAYMRAALLDPDDTEWKNALERLGVSTAP